MISETVTAIIQARLDSTRLPNKALLNLAGKPLLAHVIERSKQIIGIDRIILATGNLSTNLPLIQLAESMKIHYFSGSDDNVLERFYKASELFGGDFIVRITGDNPFIDPYYASLTVKNAIITNSDLYSLTDLPLGIAVEIIKKDALVNAYQNSTENYHFEHVTPYIKENPHLFKILRDKSGFINPFPSLRLTVDEENDYQFAKIIYNELNSNDIFSLQDILNYISNNPQIMNINKNVRQRKMTESSK